MKVSHTEKQEHEVEIIDDVVCNKCGDSCVEEETGDIYGLVEAEVTGGFWSTSLQDKTAYNFTLCEECLTDLFAEFKHPVEETEFSVDEEVEDGTYVPGDPEFSKLMNELSEEEMEGEMVTFNGSDLKKEDLN